MALIIEETTAGNTPHRHWEERLRLAGRIADQGGRSVLEALQAVQRGAAIADVLEQFSRLPRSLDRSLVTRIVGVSTR
jgi:hypothetical protein